MVSFGRASGPAPAVNPSDLREKCLRVAGGSIFSYIAAPAELDRRATEVVEAIERGWLDTGTGRAYELGRAADAHRAIESRARTETVSDDGLRWSDRRARSRGQARHKGHNTRYKRNASITAASAAGCCFRLG